MGRSHGFTGRLAYLSAEILNARRKPLMIDLKPELPLKLDDRMGYLQQIVQFSPSRVRREAAMLEIERLRAMRRQGRAGCG